MTQEATVNTVDARELRNAFGQFGSGVTVVTTRGADGTPHGATVNAFTAVSLDPPLAQVTLARGSKAARLLEGEPFAINILSVGQLDTAFYFAGRPMNSQPGWTLAGKVPVLLGNAATLECKPWNIYDGGDHVIVVGEVTALVVNEVEPLLVLGGEFRHVGDQVEGAPSAQSGDGLAGGWFAGADSLKTFG